MKNTSSSMLRQEPSPSPTPPPSSSTKLLARPPVVNLDDSSSNNVSELGQWDVLLGRGTGPNDHSGNKYYREIVEQQTEAYFATANRTLKAQMIQGTIQQVKTKRGRFLKKLEKHEIGRLGLLPAAAAGKAIYGLADSASQIEKTKQAFRYAYKKAIIKKDDPEEHEDKNDDKDEDGRTSSETHRKQKVVLYVVHNDNNKNGSKKRKESQPGTGSSGETSGYLPPVQKKARNETAAVSFSSSESAAARTALTKSSSSSSSSLSSRIIGGTRQVSPHTMNPAPALFSNTCPGALNHLATLINSPGPRANESSSTLLSALLAAATTASGGGLDLAAATTARPPSSSCLPWQSQHHLQQTSQGIRSPYSTMRTLSVPLSLGGILDHRSVLDEIAHSASAEALLRHALRAREVLPSPHQLAHSSWLAPGQHQRWK